jgi:two-component system, cell cycle response regulator
MELMQHLSGTLGSGYAATRPAALDALTSPAVAVPGAVNAVPALKLVVRGFNSLERSLLEGTVKVSQRRTPRLQLLADTEVDAADVVLIDTRDARAMDWARRHPVLKRKAVIWVDGTSADPGHTLARRPVQWPILPMLLARALEQVPAADTGPAQARQIVGAATSGPSVTQPLLVVDDSLAIRAHLRSLLEARGFAVVEATGAQAAIDAVSRTEFACVLMDVLMPGLDGYEGCKQIKARLRGALNVPVVMLTSKSSPFDRIRGKMVGCDAYLTKPVNPQQLHDVLVQHIVRPVERGGRTISPADPSAAPSFVLRQATQS